MSQYILEGMQLTAAADLAEHRLVKLSAARTVDYAGADDGLAIIGVTQHAADEGLAVHVQDAKVGGTKQVEAAGEITPVNSLVKPAANGRIQALGTGATEPAIGVALETASGEGAIIEVRLFANVQVTDTT